jgi:hypothetical protein
MTPDAVWDITAITAVGVLVAAIVVRHVRRSFAKSGSCGGGCCGGSGKTLDKPQGGCS